MHKNAHLFSGVVGAGHTDSCLPSGEGGLMIRQWEERSGGGNYSGGGYYLGWVKGGQRTEGDRVFPVRAGRSLRTWRTLRDRNFFLFPGSGVENQKGGICIF